MGVTERNWTQGQGLYPLDYEGDLIMIANVYGTSVML